MNGGRNDHRTERPAYALAKPARAERDASDQKDEADNAHHQTAGESDLTALVDADGSLGKGREGYAAAGGIPGISALKPSSNGFERSFRCAPGDSILQATVHGCRQKTARVETVLEKAREHLRVHADRDPNFFRVVESEGALKSARSDADYGVRRGVKGERLAHDAGVGAEFVGPQAVAEHGDIVSAGFGVLIRQEEASGGGPQAEQIKKAGADHLSLKLAGFRATAPSQREWANNAGHRREKLLSLTRIILEIHIGHTELGGIGSGDARLGVDGVDLDHASDVLHGQRIQENGVDHRKNRSVRADAKRERKNGDEAEGRVLGGHAGGGTDVLPKGLHGLRLPRCLAD